MTVGFHLALTLGVGAYVDSGALRHNIQFQAAWGTTETHATHITGWELARRRQWRHVDRWLLRISQSHQSQYGLRIERRGVVPYGDKPLYHKALISSYGEARVNQAHQRFLYGDAQIHQLRQFSMYGDVTQTRAGHTAPYHELTPNYSDIAFTYHLNTTHRSSLVAEYPLLDHDPVKQHHQAGWSLLVIDRL